MFFFTTAGSRRMELADRAAAPDLDAGVGELLPDVLLRSSAFRLGSTPCLCVVRSSTAATFAALAHLEQRRQVPLGSEIVSDQAELELRRGVGGGRGDVSNVAPDAARKLRRVDDIMAASLSRLPPDLA